MMVRVTLVITYAHDDKSKLCVLYGPDCIIAIYYMCLAQYEQECQGSVVASVPSFGPLL